MSTRLEKVLEQKRKRLKAKYIERALCQKWIAHCETLLLRISEWLQPQNVRELGDGQKQWS